MQRIVICIDDEDLYNVNLGIIKQNSNKDILVVEGFNTDVYGETKYELIISLINYGYSEKISSKITTKRPELPENNISQLIFINVRKTDGENEIFFKNTYFEAFLNIQKPQQDIMDFIIYIYSRLKKNECTIVIKGVERIYSIEPDDIIFIEKSGRNTVINTCSDGCILTRTPICHLELQLMKYFCKSYKGILVNSNKIEKIHLIEKTIKLKNYDKLLPISRRCLKKAKDLFFNKN